MAHIVQSREALHSQVPWCFAFPFSELGPLTFIALASCFVNLSGLHLTEANGFPVPWFNLCLSLAPT